MTLSYGNLVQKYPWLRKLSLRWPLPHSRVRQRVGSYTGLLHRNSINSLAPGRSECKSENVIFNLVLLIGIFRSSHDNALWWMPQDLTDDTSTLVQVMAWCRQATSHYLSQCWFSSLSPCGVARPQWVNVAYKKHAFLDMRPLIKLANRISQNYTALEQWRWLIGLLQVT